MLYLGVLFLLVGILSLILNIIQYNNIKKSSDDKEIKNINYANIAFSIIIILAGVMILFNKEPSLKFAFG